MPKNHANGNRDDEGNPHGEPLNLVEAEAILGELASVFRMRVVSSPQSVESPRHTELAPNTSNDVPEHGAMYRVLVEQIPALVFITYLDSGIGEAYVSPEIESALGFTQEEWLGDPIRWYEQIHPEDKQRWSLEAARMFLTGEPLKSDYRVLARDGRVVWFKCEAKMVRKEDGSPWFIHGVGFDITELKQTEDALQQRTSALRNLSSRLLSMQDQQSRRIARELHDSLGQYLVALKMNIDQLSQPGEADKQRLFAETQRLIEICVHETRTLSHLLHPPLLDEIGFAAAAQWYVEGFAQRSGLAVTLDLPPDLKRMPDSVELALFRALQESLTNVHRHSESDQAEIRLTIEETSVSLEIEDHGRGIPPNLLDRFQKTGAGTGVGLSGIRERVRELDGKFKMNSSAQGTQISLQIPLSPNS